MFARKLFAYGYVHVCIYTFAYMYRRLYKRGFTELSVHTCDHTQCRFREVEHLHVQD